jgi:RNA polymerase sigma-70 factor (ECF subfamily)
MGQHWRGDADGDRATAWAGHLSAVPSDPPRSVLPGSPAPTGQPAGDLATRFDPTKGSATSWIFTIAHRRAVDRARSEQAGAARARRVAAGAIETPYDEVVEQATANLEQQQVRRCLQGLTDLQREAITMAYYGGYTYREVAELLNTALPTIKTRMRDGLIRMRDCLGVSLG